MFLGLYAVYWESEAECKWEWDEVLIPQTNSSFGESEIIINWKKKQLFYGFLQFNLNNSESFEGKFGNHDEFTKSFYPMIRIDVIERWISIGK